MKKHVYVIYLLIVFVAAGTSCQRKTVVLQKGKSTTVVKKDNGKHKGWYKNPNNPHHPAHNSNKNGNTTVIINNSNKGGNTVKASGNGNSGKSNMNNGKSGGNSGKSQGNGGHGGKGHSNGNSKGKK